MNSDVLELGSAPGGGEMAIGGGGMGPVSTVMGRSLASAPSAGEIGAAMPQQTIDSQWLSIVAPPCSAGQPSSPWAQAELGLAAKKTMSAMAVVLMFSMLLPPANLAVESFLPS